MDRETYMQLDRIEAKLDVLLEAAGAVEPTEQPPAIQPPEEKPKK